MVLAWLSVFPLETQTRGSASNVLFSVLCSLRALDCLQLSPTLI